MMNNRLINQWFFAIIVFLASFSITHASSTGIDVNLQVGGYCNNNNICEAGSGEDIYNCPSDCTPTPPPTSGGTTTGSTITGIYFKDLTVEASYNSVTIKWKSTIPTISSLKWGTNPDYKDGSIQNINFLLDHKITLNNLKDGTIYYFSIQSANYYGVSQSLENQKFTTLSLPDVTPPSNPTNVKATSDQSGITLSWKNPKDLDFDYIRIMRSEDRYYASPYLGKLIYEGSAEYFLDKNVIEGHKYFYVLFSRDRAGNYSSGSLISKIHNPKGIDDWGQVITPIDKLETINALFLVNQNSFTYDFYPGGVFHLSGDTNVTVKTNYFSQIKNDDLWIEIRDKDGIIIGQYFFSRERDKEGFLSVTIPLFEKGGYYNTMVYRYKDGVSQLVNYGSFDISKGGDKKSGEWSLVEIVSLSLFIFFVIIIIIILFVYIKRKISKHFHKNKEENI